MTAYDDVDPIIVAWAEVTVQKLFTEWAGLPARFGYVPGLRPFECFQISVEPPICGRITVVARSLDTDDGSEFEQVWEGAAETLFTMLGAATDAVRQWVNR